MKITYDKSVDAAYICLNETELITKTIPVQGIDGMINIDFSVSGKIVGLEIISGSKFLTQEVLNSADFIG